VYFLHRSEPARNESQSLKNATPDASRNRKTTDGVPDNSTAHRVTFNDDGLRTPASDEHIEGDCEVPLLDVRPESEYCDDSVSYYEDRDEGSSRALLPLLNNLKNTMRVPFRLFFPTTLDNGLNKPTTDGVPDNSTAHRITFNDDGLRTPASDEYIEGGNEFPLVDIRLEMGFNDGDFVARYEERVYSFFRLQLLQLLNILKNGMNILFRPFFWN
jgi:hypothetical protein